MLSILLKKRKGEQGFAVLASSVLLSTVAIIFTVNMASSQLVDNQIIGNNYRNKEAFSNAESGVNFLLGQLKDPAVAENIITNLPFEYNAPNSQYQLLVTQVHSRKIAISSYGASIDTTAIREINLEVDFYLNYPIPDAAVSTNGKLNLDDTALVNDGCEGLDKQDCLGSGNVANHMLITNPYIEEEDDFCSGGSLGENIIADGVLHGATEAKEVDVITNEEGEISFDWTDAHIPEGSAIAGIDSDSSMQANSLFEATFGLEMNPSNLNSLWDYAVKIDTNNGDSCSEMLQGVDDESSIIFIKGDCDIDQYYAEQSKTSENKVLTIGSVEHPKLVFIEGGTFITAPNTGTAVVGMLYFLPDKKDLVDEYNNPTTLDGLPLAEGQDVIQVESSSVDMGGINVTGALLSEYKCSHDGYDKTDSTGTKQHFSARFDKLVLEELYSVIGIKASDSGYRVSAGTWRDF